MSDALWANLHQALATGSRSTALKPLGWLIAIVLPSAVLSARLGSPAWLSATLGALSVATIVLYCVAYVYLLAKDRDALRSERYSIQKLAIEKGFVGDSVTGYLNRSDQTREAEVERSIGAEESR